MKQALWIILAGVVLMVALFFLGANPAHNNLPFSPWDIKKTDDHIQVFGIHLQHSTLEQAANTIVQPEKVVIFTHENKTQSAEAFFGRIYAQGVSGKLIATLKPTADFPLDGYMKDPAKNGGWQYPIQNWSETLLAQSVVESLTFLPDARSLKTEVMEALFGEKSEHTTDPDGHQIWWFEPLQLRVLQGGRGKMVIEYGVLEHTPSPDGVVDSESHKG